MWGYIGGTACIIGTFVVYIALGFAGVTTNWALGICTALAGVWWFVTSWFAFARLPVGRATIWKDSSLKLPL